MPASRSRPPLTPGPDGIVRLAGGNPQIAKGDGDAVVQSYIAAMPGWQREIGRQLDVLICETVPGVVKAVRWNTPFYGLEPGFWFASFHCLTRYVKLAFPRGAELDPLPPEGSRQPLVRYVHFHEGEPLDEAQLRDWFVQASRLPGEKF